MSVLTLALGLESTEYPHSYRLLPGHMEHYVPFLCLFPGFSWRLRGTGLAMTLAETYILQSVSTSSTGRNAAKKSIRLVYTLACLLAV